MADVTVGKYGKENLLVDTGRTVNGATVYAEAVAIVGANGAVAPLGTVSDPDYSVVRGCKYIVPGQVTVGTTATYIVGGRADRSRIIIKNTSAAAVYLGRGGVLTSGGYYLGAGERLEINTTDEVYAVVSSGTALVTFLEEINS